MSFLTAYIGTYSKGERGGIFRAVIDDESGNLEIAATTDIENPSFLMISPDGKKLHAVSETKTWNGRNGGAAASFSIASDGELTLLNSAKTEIMPMWLLNWDAR